MGTRFGVPVVGGDAGAGCAESSAKAVLDGSVGEEGAGMVRAGDGDILAGMEGKEVLATDGARLVCVGTGVRDVEGTGVGEGAEFTGNSVGAADAGLCVCKQWT